MFVFSFTEANYYFSNILMKKFVFLRKLKGLNKTMVIILFCFLKN